MKFKDDCIIFNGKVIITKYPLTVNTIFTCKNYLEIASSLEVNKNLDVFGKTILDDLVVEKFSKFCGRSKFMDDVFFRNNVLFNNCVVFEEQSYFKNYVKFCNGIHTNKIISCKVLELDNVQIQVLDVKNNATFHSDVEICEGNLIVNSIKPCNDSVTVDGNLIVNNNLIIQGTTIFDGTTITEGDFEVCDGSLIVNNIESCNNDPVHFQSDVDLCDHNLILSTITNCPNQNFINIQSNVNICNYNLSVSNVQSCSDSPIVFQSDVNFCQSNLLVSQLSKCPNFDSIFINDQVVIQNNSTLFVNQIESNDPAVTFNSPVNICQGLNVSTITGCNGPIIFNSPLSLCDGITTNSIISCDQNPIMINSPSTFNFPIRVCSGLTTNSITSCDNVSPVDFQSPVNICQGLNVSTITSCTTDPITFQSDVDFCDSTIFASTITKCDGINNLIINGPTTHNGELIVTGNFQANGVAIFFDDVRICNGLLYVNTIENCSPTDPIIFNSSVNICQGIKTSEITSCTGDPIIFNSPINICQGLNVSIITSCTTDPITFQSDVDFCQSDILINTITKCDGINNITINGPTTHNGELIVSGGEFRSQQVAIFFDNVRVCDGIFFVNTIQNCDPDPTINPITFNSPVSICQGLNTSTITSCTGDPIIFQSDVDFCQSNMLVNTITKCDGANNITINGPTIHNNNFEFNNDVIIDGLLTLNGGLELCNSTLKINTIESCTANPITFNSPVNICQGLNVSTITSCTTDPITFNSDVDFCQSDILVNTITKCDGINNITINGPTTHNGELIVTGNFQANGVAIFFDDVRVCNGLLYVNTIENCTTDPIIFNSSVNICQGIKTSEITSCTGDPIIFNSDVDFCQSNILVNTINKCDGINNITINGPTTHNGELIVTGGEFRSNGIAIFFDNVRVCDGTFFVNTIESCTGDPITFNSDVDFCQSDILVNTITKCDGINNIIINGPTTHNGELIVTGNFQANGVAIFFDDVRICNGLLYVNTIENCSPTDPIIFNSSVNICQGIKTSEITSCTGDPIIFNSDINMCNQTLSVDNIQSCTGQLNVLSEMNFCNSPIFVSEISKCPNFDAITINDDVVIDLNSTLFVNTIQSNTDAIDFIDTVVNIYQKLNVAVMASTDLINNTIIVESNINMCNYTLSVNNIEACTNTDIVNFIGNVSICDGLSVSTIQSCDNINNIPIIFQSDVNMCNQTLFLDQVEKCSGVSNITINSSIIHQGDFTLNGIAIFSNDVRICNGILNVNTIQSCDVISPITIQSDVSMCNQTLFIDNIQSCNATINMNSVNISDYNLTNVNIGTGTLIAVSPLTGGNTRNFRTIDEGNLIDINVVSDTIIVSVDQTALDAVITNAINTQVPIMLDDLGLLGGILSLNIEKVDYEKLNGEKVDINISKNKLIEIDHLFSNFTKEEFVLLQWNIKWKESKILSNKIAYIQLNDNVIVDHELTKLKQNTFKLMNVQSNQYLQTIIKLKDLSNIKFYTYVESDNDEIITSSKVIIEKL